MESYSKLYSDVSHSVTVQRSSSPCGGGGGGGSGVGGGGGGGGFGCIEHAVSRFDTLAGVAIRYGVEVADIKKMNGLTTDLQMFARKSLKIPLPGRHPPSPIMSNGYHTQGQTSPEVTHPSRRHSDSFNPIKPLKLSSSPQRSISSSINSLRDYYGLTPNVQNGVGEGRPQCPEMLLKHDNNNNNTNNGIILSASAGKGLALRQKAANRTTIESEAGSSNVFAVSSRDSSIVQAFSGVRKSSSAPSFQQSETDNNNGNNNNASGPSSLLFWPMSILNFKADLQALSTTTPIFDGLPKPMSGRKSKAARD
ncbi:hypothetical protein OSB04_021891 [Centaurea solstitialis]|uniref:LysM domain-containing protein n=1 Tax=Centaurea solstitialis TaxID=347529 RepID=A0AA38T2T2_9ASTR|nr:hypothetical protein OSB04_021891 [Centaurea solstitialis]